ncbi:hypothetical protein EOT10_29420 [Streptomyces antnestii]|uniref:Uncharacterized protein n=1 Tax=Streptomyces antnestii TaxID=2494256 RepID=A0A3S2VX30_9ACTN|nr:hypothetical protein [Streptomyces sp. San01]RVU19601.1 hypothetical protein EOT10_29420 [Streptomyces sp. San01]
MGGWGAPPPKKSSTGKTLAIVAGCIAGAFILMSGIRELQGGHGAAPDPSAQQYRLTLPETIDGGAFRLGQDVSDRFDNSANADDAYARSLQSEAGFYDAKSGSGQLLYSGSYSDRQDPFYPKMGLLDGIEENDSMTVAIPRRDMDEQSSDGDQMACEVLTKADGGQKLTMAVCSWTDRYTQGAIVDNSPDSFGVTPEKYDLDTLAKRTARIRDEVRVPVED